MLVSSRTPFWSFARISIGLTIGTLSVAPSRCDDFTLDRASRVSLEALDPVRDALQCDRNPTGAGTAGLTLSGRLAGLVRRVRDDLSD